MTVYDTEVGRAYARVAHLSECTIGALHAIDIAEWIVEQRHPVRSRWERLTRGETAAWWQAQALREHFARIERKGGKR